VVGDDDQSILSLAGADIRNILDFEQDFPGVVTVKAGAELSFHPEHPRGAAGQVVAKEPGRKPKTLWSDNPAGERIVLTGGWPTSREEARYVCREIERHVGAAATCGTCGWSSTVTNAQSRVLEDAMVARRDPRYHMVGGMRFYERLEVKEYPRLSPGSRQTGPMRCPSSGSSTSRPGDRPAPRWIKSPSWAMRKGSPSTTPWPRRGTTAGCWPAARGASIAGFMTLMWSTLPHSAVLSCRWRSSPPAYIEETG